MEQDRKAKLFDGASDDAILDIAADLVNLTLQQGWYAWEGMLRDSREDALEHLAEAGPDMIRYWQGYVAALLHVLEGPKFLADRAREIQDAKAEETGAIDDRVRVGFGGGESII